MFIRRSKLNGSQLKSFVVRRQVYCVGTVKLRGVAPKKPVKSRVRCFFKGFEDSGFSEFFQVFQDAQKKTRNARIFFILKSAKIQTRKKFRVFIYPCRNQVRVLTLTDGFTV